MIEFGICNISSGSRANDTDPIRTVGSTLDDQPSQIPLLTDSASAVGGISNGAWRESTHNHPRKRFPRPFDDEGTFSYRAGRERARHAGGRTRRGHQTRLCSGNNRLYNGRVWLHIECFLSAAQSCDYGMPRLGQSSLIDERGQGVAS
jgi:hypothetical protein